MNWIEKTWLRATGRGHIVEVIRRMDEDMMRIRETAARLWHEAGGHSGNAGRIHSFMVTHPETRAKFERLAAIELGIPTL